MARRGAMFVPLEQGNQGIPSGADVARVLRDGESAAWSPPDGLTYHESEMGHGMVISGREIRPDSVVVARRQQISVELDDETLILHLSTAGYYQLEKVGARIWRMLDDPIRVSEIGDTLARQYGVPRDRCEEDVLDLLAQLAERDLIDVLS